MVLVELSTLSFLSSLNSGLSFLRFEPSNDVLEIDVDVSENRKKANKILNPVWSCSSNSSENVTSLKLIFYARARGSRHQGE